MDSDEDEDDALDEEAFKPPQPRKLMPAPTKRTPAAPSTKAKAVGKKTAEELMKVRQANASYALPPPSQLAAIILHHQHQQSRQNGAIHFLDCKMSVNDQIKRQKLSTTENQTRESNRTSITQRMGEAIK
ncbi:hypothetical protein ACQ4LE_001528 [Meloidogyne hapla]